MSFVKQNEEILISDEDLIKNYLNGQASAFRKILRRYTSFVMNLIMKYVHDNTVAEDLTQEVFYNVLSNIDKFRGESKFKTYLFTITRNMSIDYLRKAKYRKTDSLDESISDDQKGHTLMEVIPDTNCDSEVKAMNKEVRDSIESAIEKLPPDQKEVFILREIAKLQFSEIAEILEENENTIKSRMRYALLFLRKELIQYRTQT